MSRYDGWWRRAYVGDVQPWGELFADLSGSGEFAEWKAWAQAAVTRRAIDDAEVQFGLTRVLFSELIYAAGGVERALARLEAGLADAQRVADDIVAKFDWDPTGPRPGFTGPELLDVSYSYIDVLAWGRVVRERVKRRWVPPPGVKNPREHVGLLPALAAGPLRDAVAAALADYDGRLTGYRELANFALHAGAVPGGGTPRGVIRDDGTITVRAPDPPIARVPTWEAFTFDRGEDQLGQARHVMHAVEQFVERVLTAWEDNIPERIRKR